jgi:hypothetical protein
VKALLDACVLVPPVLREVLFAVAGQGLFTPLWSSRIVEEWARAAGRTEGAASEAIARGEAARLAARWPGSIVTHGPADEAALWLPDAADMHVLAAAIVGKAEVIVTFNLRDFPRRALDAQRLRAQHPDAFLMDLWLAAPDQVMAAAESVRHQAERLSARPQPLRALLKRAGLPRLGKALGG